MKKTIIAIMMLIIAIMMLACFYLMIASFCMPSKNHYFEGKWYKWENCSASYNMELVVEKMPKCSITNGACTDYDDKGNLIHRRTSDGRETWYKWDTKGNVIHLWDSHSYNIWIDYDEKGNRTHYKDTDGHEEWYKWIYDIKDLKKYHCKVDQNGNPKF